MTPASLARALICEARAQVDRCGVGPIARPIITSLCDALKEALISPPDEAGEEVVDRMIRAIAAHSTRDWDADPIQEGERDWMRPLARAAVAAAPAPDKPADLRADAERGALAKRLRFARENMMDGRIPRYGQILVAAEAMERAEEVLAARADLPTDSTRHLNGEAGA